MVRDPPSFPDLPSVSGRFQAGAHYYPLRVYFEDTDAGGVVYHANYLCFMERARSDMLHLIGIEQRKTMDAGGGVYAVAKLAIDYVRPARLDDNLVVESRVTEVRAATCAIAQRVFRGTELIASASVLVAFISPEGKPRRQPPAWIDLFNRIAQGNDLTP